MMRRTRVLAALAAALCFLSSRAAPAAPVHVVDALQRDVVIDVPVKRAIVGFNFEEFTAVAGPRGWDRVVGLSKAPWASWRATTWAAYVRAVPRLGTLADVGYSEDGTFSVEKVLSLRPDVLILSRGEYASLGPGRETLAAARVPIVVIDYNAQTLSGHLDSTRVLGAVTGASARAARLNALYARKYADIMSRVKRARAAGAPSARVYVELGRDGAGSIGNTYDGTMWGRILTTLDARNIATGHIAGGWGQMHPEAVLAADPAYVFIAGSSWENAPRAVHLGLRADAATARASLATYAARPGWSGLTAVRDGHLYALDHALCRTLFDYTAMEFIAKQLYPAAFRDVDPMQDLRDYYGEFLPIPLTGAWMTAARP